ncbi:MAG: DUF11 domain-containing protein, partial [Actinobacteria bacterium]|nr:DUF11 domain-containing protein [Actinomycetota bacterium]
MSPASAQRSAAPEPIITRVAGTQCCAYTGDGGPATDAQLIEPRGVDTDPAGNLYIADLGNHVIRVVDTSGIITTVAGNGTWGYSGDGGPATEAQLALPSDVSLDAAGNIYIADIGTPVIRMVDTDGIIHTVAGTGVFGYSGDGGPATEAQIGYAQALWVDAAGNIYIADTSNNVIRMVDTEGIITTVAGTGVAGYSGDGGPATEAQLNFPTGVAVDAAGNIYIADDGNNRLRMVDTEGIITTIAGTGEDGYTGEGGPATEAALSPTRVTVDPLGTVLVSDALNGVVVKIDSSGIITTVAGGGSPKNTYDDEGLPATDAVLIQPYGITVDAAGNLYIAEDQRHQVRAVGALFVTKSDSPDPVPTRARLTYTIEVGNVSWIDATNTVLTETLASSSRFRSATASQGACTQSSGVVTCDLGTIAAGASAKVTVVVTAPNTAGAGLTNTASFEADHPDTLFLDDTAVEETTIIHPSLLLTKSDAPDPVTEGEPVTYTLTVGNALAKRATAVTLTDTVPAGASFVSATSSQGTCAEAGGTVTCDLGGLRYQAEAT